MCRDSRTCNETSTILATIIIPCIDNSGIFTIATCMCMYHAQIHDLEMSSPGVYHSYLYEVMHHNYFLTARMPEHSTVHLVQSAFYLSVSRSTVDA